MHADLELDYRYVVQYIKGSRNAWSGFIHGSDVRAYLQLHAKTGLLTYADSVAPDKPAHLKLYYLYMFENPCPHVHALFVDIE